MTKPVHPPSNKTDKPRLLVCQNRRAKHVLAIEDTYEAGIALVGTEVKSLRAGQAHLNEAYVQIVNGQVVLIGGHIGEYSHGNQFNHAPTRSRKLLLNAREIAKLTQKIGHKGYTALPLSLYFNGRGIAKLEFGIGRGKGDVDKRHDIRDKEAVREVARVLRQRNR